MYIVPLKQSVRNRLSELFDRSCGLLASTVRHCLSGRLSGFDKDPVGNHENAKLDNTMVQLVSASSQGKIINHPDRKTYLSGRKVPEIGTIAPDHLQRSQELRKMHVGNDNFMLMDIFIRKKDKNSFYSLNNNAIIYKKYCWRNI